MLKRNMILLFGLVAITASIHAQVRPGVRLGYNLSGVTADYTGTIAKNPYNLSNPDNFHLKSGFQVGLIGDFPINDAFAVQPGIRFSMQGFSDTYRSGAPNGHKVTRNLSLYYLQIPVYVQYRWNVYEETNVLFQAGPYAALGLFGRQSINSPKTNFGTGDDKFKKISYGNGASYDIQKVLDYGVGAGIGIEFHRFQFVVGYDFGINKAPFKKDAKSGWYNVDFQNQNFSVTLAIIFGKRDPLQNQRN